MAQQAQSARNLTDHPLFIGLALIAAAVLAAILYWPTLKLPILYDDLLHIRISGSLDFLSVWLPTEAFGFYRPLTFLPLLIIERLFGYYPPWLLHGLNVFTHALNVFLVGGLSWRLWHRPHWAVVSALLLALFPFSYQAIAVYGHNVHPTTAFLILLMLHSYLSAMRAGDHPRRWWLVTTILFILGLLSHESTVLFGLFAAFLHWNEQGCLPKIDRENLGKSLVAAISAPWFGYIIAGGIYFIAYQFLPLSRAPQASFATSSFVYKLLYVAQAIGYPITWLARFLPSTNTISVLLVLFALVVTLGLTWWSAQEKDNRLPLLMGWGWWFLASLIIVVPLPASYLLHGPRLLYLSSLGLALLWPVLLEPLYRPSMAGRLAWLGLLLLILLTNWIFVRERLGAYQQLTEPVTFVESALPKKLGTLELEGDEGILMVNLPSWLAPAKNTFPIGVEFVAMLGDYLFVEELVGQNLRADHPAQAVRVPDLLMNYDYTFGIHKQSFTESIQADWSPKGSHVFIVDYTPFGPKTRYSGYFSRQPNPSDGGISFGSYELITARATYCDPIINLLTTWRAASDPRKSMVLPPTTSLFVQLLDEGGQLVAQADGPPLGLRPDLVALPRDWQMLDHRELAASNAQDGSILIGVYDFMSGERYEAIDSDGQSWPDNALKIPIEECPPKE